MAKGSTGVSMGGSIEYTRMKKKKENPEITKKKEAARKEVERREALPKNFNLCWKCGFYYQESCTFDGSANPVKTECKEFVSKAYIPKKKRNYGKKKRKK